MQTKPERIDEGLAALIDVILNNTSKARQALTEPYMRTIRKSCESYVDTVHMVRREFFTLNELFTEINTRFPDWIVYGQPILEDHGAQRRYSEARPNIIIRDVGMQSMLWTPVSFDGTPSYSTFYFSRIEQNEGTEKGKLAYDPNAKFYLSMDWGLDEFGIYRGFGIPEVLRKLFGLDNETRLWDIEDADDRNKQVNLAVDDFFRDETDGGPKRYHGLNELIRLDRDAANHCDITDRPFTFQIGGGPNQERVELKLNSAILHKKGSLATVALNLFEVIHQKDPSLAYQELLSRLSQEGTLYEPKSP